MSIFTDALIIYELSKIWKEAAYNFAFWDKVNIDWDEEYKEALARVLNTEDRYDYYLELKRFVALLNDGHTNVSFPNEIYQGAEFFSMFPVYFAKPGDEIIVAATSEDVKDDKDMLKSKRKIPEEIWEGEQIPGVSDIVRFAPSACNSQPWFVKNNGELLVYRFRKPGKRGIMPADKVSFYNRIDIGIFICFMDICLGHNGIGFEKTLYSDAGDDDKELVLNAKYRLCG